MKYLYLVKTNWTLTYEYDNIQAEEDVFDGTDAFLEPVRGGHVFADKSRHSLAAGVALISADNNTTDNRWYSVSVPRNSWRIAHRSALRWTYIILIPLLWMKVLSSTRKFEDK